MSSATYEEVLREAIVDLSEMQELDGKSVGKRIGANKQQDYNYFLQHWSAMYLRYMQIVRKLDDVHDQMLQPQKRQDVRVLLDSCIGRMLEMKNQIITYCGEYVNLDEALVDLKLTPDALEIPVPKYFVEERQAELKERRSFISRLVDMHDVGGKGAADGGLGGVSTVDALPEMKLDKAIEIIQANERGRQGRQRAKFLKQIYDTEQTQQNDFDNAGCRGREEAARTIQKIVRGFIARKKATRMMKEELEFLGLEMSEKVASNYQRDELRRALDHRKTTQEANLRELERESREMRQRIKIQEGGRTMEEMLDQVLLHMANVRLMSKDEVVPEFPSEEDGGSLALLGRIQKPPTAEEEAAKKAEEEKAAGNKKPGGKQEKKTDKELEEEALPTLQKSLFWDRFSSARERYVGTWNQQFQKSYLEMRNFEQGLDKEILREEIMDGPGGVTAELRHCVDQLVMVEVNNLKERLEREKGKKPKKPKAPKKPKKKNVKDPSDGHKVEEHMSRLVQEQALLLPKNIKLEEYIGAHNYMGAVMDEHDKQKAEQLEDVRVKWQTLLNNWNDTVQKALRLTKEQFEEHYNTFCKSGSWMFEPSMAQVRQSVAEYCILPLGSQVVHDLAPNNPAVLLYGPPRSGKTMLTHAICNESGANLFSLSPNVVGREGINIPKLVQSVFRIAKTIAPSVIYIDEVDRIFTKKKAKGDPIAGKLQKMKKDLLQGIKELDPTDRVIVIGNSRAPWNGENKDMVAFFKNMIYCVHPDYASRMLIWQTRIKALGATLLNDYEYEILAYMTNMYTSGTIIQVIDETLSQRRLKRVAQRPIKAEEFLPALSRARPMFIEDFNNLKDLFIDKLPLTLRRAKMDPENGDFKVEVVDDKKKPGGKKPGGKKK